MVECLEVGGSRVGARLCLKDQPQQLNVKNGPEMGFGRLWRFAAAAAGASHTAALLTPIFNHASSLPTVEKRIENDRCGAMLG